jgi:hypothetical protein
MSFAKIRGLQVWKYGFMSPQFQNNYLYQHLHRERLGEVEKLEYLEY